MYYAHGLEVLSTRSEHIFPPTQALLLLQLQDGNSTLRTGQNFILINDCILIRWLRKEERAETQKLLPRTTDTSVNSRKQAFHHTHHPPAL